MPTSPNRTEFEGMSDLVPEGALLEQAWRITKFISQDGTEMFNWDCDGSPTIADTLGALELIKFDALASTFIEDEEEKDDDLDDL